MLPIRTTDVALRLGCKPWQLRHLITTDRIQPAPTKDSAGDYLWTDADIERARLAIASWRPYERQAGKAPTDAK